MFRVSYPSRLKYLPDDLNGESVISLRITIYDTQIQILTNNILLDILYMVCIKSKYSINNVRKKEKLHLLLLFLK